MREAYREFLGLSRTDLSILFNEQWIGGGSNSKSTQLGRENPILHSLRSLENLLLVSIAPTLLRFGLVTPTPRLQSPYFSRAGFGFSHFGFNLFHILPKKKNSIYFALSFASLHFSLFLRLLWGWDFSLTVFSSEENSRLLRWTSSHPLGSDFHKWIDSFNPDATLRKK